MKKQIDMTLTEFSATSPKLLMEIVSVTDITITKKGIYFCTASDSSDVYHIDMTCTEFNRNSKNNLSVQLDIGYTVMLTTNAYQHPVCFLKR